jgi:2-(1,2-epoxy-1,2-dihydrophenyl)acetyl-CoA isomerase
MTLSATPSLLVERNGPIATLKLNRPDVGNAIDIPLARALMEAAIACDEDDAIRCVVVTGSGRLFCAGGDVGSFNAAGDSIGGYLKEITVYHHAAISRLAHMNKPVLTVINGPVAGGGIGLALIGDIAIAGRSAHFTLAYSALGLSPDGGSTWLLPRLIGLRRTQEMALLNRRITAEEAVSLGMITRVVDDAALSTEAANVASRLAASATLALGKVRSLLLNSSTATFESQMQAEADAIAAMGQSTHGREGVAAFVAKRKPDFT